MACCVCVIHGMIVSSCAIPVLSTTTEMSAGHAKPEVSVEIAILAVSKGFGSNLLGSCLIKKESVLASFELEFPFFDCFLQVCRLSHKH